MGNDFYRFVRSAMTQIPAVCALPVAGVFTFSLGTIWLRTGLMPCWLSAVTYLGALVLLLSFSLSVWMVLIFPGWVFVISVCMLIQNLRRRRPDTIDVAQESYFDQILEVLVWIVLEDEGCSIWSDWPVSL